jgi:AcrR family transcriptional regulator
MVISLPTMSSLPAVPPRARSREATRRRVLDAVVTTVIQRGYYDASSNEIARQAGVSWGSINYLFGSRRQLMLEVVADWVEHLRDHVEQAEITGETLEERLRCMLEVLADIYEAPAFIVQVQILLDLSVNPDRGETSHDVVDAVSHGGKEPFAALLRRTLGEDTSPDLLEFAFVALKGYLVARGIATVMGPSDDEANRALLVQSVADTVRSEMARRGEALG